MKKSLYIFLLLFPAFIFAQSAKDNFTPGSLVAEVNNGGKAGYALASTSNMLGVMGVFAGFNDQPGNNGAAEIAPEFMSKAIRRALITNAVTSVKVNSENGPVKKGDLITVSSKPGEAAKAVSSGIMIGIAAEDADPKTGLVKARIMIQYVKL